MFTGIVQGTGRIVALTQGEAAARLTVAPTAGCDLAAEARPPRVGDSICVSGVCLTIAALGQGGELDFDVVAETLCCTKLGALSEGEAVNLEPAVTPTQPLGGHFMQGHVDAVGLVDALTHDAETGEWRLCIRVGAEVGPYLTPKGAIAVDGVSLTIAAVDEAGFEVALIPTTLNLTTLGGLELEARVNLETDILARTAIDWLHQRLTRSEAGLTPETEAVTRDLLETTGFKEM